jgi:hypothetical protein
MMDFGDLPTASFGHRRRRPSSRVRLLCHHPRPPLLRPTPLVWYGGTIPCLTDELLLLLPLIIHPP